MEGIRSDFWSKGFIKKKRHVEFHRVAIILDELFGLVHTPVCLLPALGPLGPLFDPDSTPREISIVKED